MEASLPQPFSRQGLRGGAGWPGTPTLSLI